jgi:peptidoglycan hydrolase-like protein with peptidoglycan-binding domain
MRAGGMRHSRVGRTPLVAGLVAVGLAVAACTGTTTSSPPSGQHLSPAAAQKPRPPAPLKVASIMPPAGKPGSPGVSPASTITVTFSRAISPSTATPKLVPAVPGTWTHPASNALEFVPAGGLPVAAKLQLKIPGGTHGVKAADGGALTNTFDRTIQVQAGSLTRLQELLAEQGYLPLRFHPTSAQGTSMAAQARDAAMAPSGFFTWRWDLSALTGQWSVGTLNTITRGAVMTFEIDHGLPPDGVPGPEVWKALIGAQLAAQHDPAPYSYVYVTETSPELLHLYENGVETFTTDVNTGIEAAPTALGTYPIYVRYTVTTMTGTNPDGTKYSDPGIPWVSYFNGGDALHGFLRSYYGFPQSLGCVEMPFQDAHTVFEATNYGTLVTVAS